jgi:5-formyltetrahydrofolate cyclo-ligase
MGSTTSLIRVQMIQRRIALSQKQYQEAANAFLTVLVNHPILSLHQHIGVYLAQKNELNLQPAIEALWQKNKTLYLPVLHPTRPYHLLFSPYTPDMPLLPNRYGILEPKITVDEMIAPSELDLVLMPLVAFDARGNRIGMGAGYYDRSFQPLPETKKPVLVGCAYTWQEVPLIDAQPWDMPLDLVVTDQGSRYTHANK